MLFFFIFLYFWMRGTFPRYRYDQIMHLFWHPSWLDSWLPELLPDWFPSWLFV